LGLEVHLNLVVLHLPSFAMIHKEFFLSSTILRSYYFTWEPLVSSNIASHVVSTQPESLLKTRYTHAFELYPSKNPSYTLGANLEDLDLF
jgi:hypothetical protein